MEKCNSCQSDGEKRKSFKVVAAKAYDIYERGDTVIAGYESYKAADDFACRQVFVHANEALANEGPLVRIVEDCGDCC